MSHPRRLIFHIGAAKTGTSAIQRFLAVNTGPLRDCGLDYLRGEPPLGQLPTVGNGVPLYQYFMQGERDPQKLENLLSGYFDTQPGAVVSFEMLSSLPEGCWRAILRACQAQNVEPSFVYYVRNVYPLYLSTYNQLVKNHGLTSTFEEFAGQRSVFHCAGVLDLLTRLAGPGRVHAAHYESEQANICEHFLATVCPGADRAKFAFPAGLVNRSLDAPELRLMRIANKYPAAHFPGELPNLLISRDPDRRAAQPFNPRVIKLLTRRHGRDVKTINMRYFGGQQKLLIAGAMPSKPDKTARATAPAELLFEWALAKLGPDRHTGLQTYLDQARALAAKSKKPFGAQFPSGFDAAAYLIANPDLLLARVNPYTHFLEHGCEEGRSWRIDGKQISADRQNSSYLNKMIEKTRQLLGRLSLKAS
ncbi:MAG TPA: hypothetical protein VFG05_08275 [Methylocella sp.]|nr:hypothetical protein [Methylocella sp.]